MSEEPRAPDGRTGKEILAKVLAQPETKQIADSLGLDLNEYAELVVHYALHPKEDLELAVMDDAQARAAGMPSPQECVQFLEKIHSGEIDVTPETERTRFAGSDEHEHSSVTLTGGAPVTRAPAIGEATGAVVAAEPSAKGAALKSQVLAARDMARAGERRPVKQDAKGGPAAVKQQQAPPTAQQHPQKKGRTK